MPFHLGVIKSLKDIGVMNDKSHYAGTSGGSICSLLACSDMPPEEALELIVKMSTDPVIWDNMDLGIRKTLDELITHDKLALCQDRLHIATTKVWPKPQPQVTMFSQYATKQHLIDCIAASCFIPLYGARKMTVDMLHSPGHSYIDGGVFAFMPPVGKVTISPFSDAHFPVKPPNFRPIDIHLDKQDYPLAKLLYRALKPAPAEELRKMYEKGVVAGDKWSHNHSSKSGLGGQVSQS